MEADSCFPNAGADALRILRFVPVVRGFKLVTGITVAHVAQAGAILTDIFVVGAELMRTWNRAESSRFAEILVEHVCPEYKCLIESFEKAQKVVAGGPETQVEKYQ